MVYCVTPYIREHRPACGDRLLAIQLVAKYPLEMWLDGTRVVWLALAPPTWLIPMRRIR